MGIRNSLFGKPENPVQKAAVAAVCELTGYEPAKIMGSDETHKVEVKDDAVLVHTSTGLRLSESHVQKQAADTQSKLKAAGLELDKTEIHSDRIVTGVGTVTIPIPAERNGGFSGIADKINAHLGKEAPAQQSQVDKLAARAAEASQASGRGA